MSNIVRDAVREALERKGWTQRDLAKILGVTEGWVSHIVADWGNPTIETLGGIAQGLGMPLHIRFCHCSASGGFICTPCKERAESITADVDVDSLGEWLASWGDGPNWSDASGETVPISKVTLRKMITALRGPTAPTAAPEEE